MKRLAVSVGVSVSLALWEWPSAHASSHGATDQSQSESIELSKRLASSLPAAGEPPPVPAAADALPPMTLELVATWEGTDGQRGRATQTILRTPDRVLLVTDQGAKEWLFERNPVDPRRVSGYLIDHAQHEILVYHDSDLRNRLHLRGWGDVLMMRLDPDVLAALRPTGEQQAAGGATFEQHVERQPGSGAVVEVWWSDRLLLPLRLTVREGSVLRTSTFEALESGVATTRLADPRARFPCYEVLDFTDSLERHH